MMRPTLLSSLGVLAGLGGLADAGTAGGTTIAPPKPLVAGKVFDRLITIWLENQDYLEVVGDARIGDLRNLGISLSSFFALTHPSQPNYIASVGGDYFGLNHDDYLRIPDNVSTIVDLLESKKISWAGYFEDAPGPGFMGVGSDGSSKQGWDYVRKHNPFVSYDSITHDGERLLNLLSFDDFQRAFQAKQVPQFVFMSPNQINNGHNSSMRFSTDWAYTFLKPLLAEDAFDERTLIMLTYDEAVSEDKPNRVFSILLGNAIPKNLRGTDDSLLYTHYSMLSTVELNWDLPHLGRYDVGANVFQVVADLAGYRKNRQPDNHLTVNNSVSYPGAFHDDPKSRLPIPVPNARLTGASGKPILDTVQMIWEAASDVPTPYDGSGNIYDGGQNLPIYAPQRPNPQ